MKSFIVKFDELISQIRSYQEQSSQIKINEPLSIKKICKNNELNDNFIYSQLLNDYLLQIKSISNLQNELNIICEFENDCSSNRTLWWYTRETFIYHLLNKAFRIQNKMLILSFSILIHTSTNKTMTATQNSIEQSFECGICHDYLTEVRETPCCHQLFCFTCIQQWLNQGGSCPQCKSTSLTENTLLKNVVLQRIVDNIELDCPYVLAGCSAKVPRCDLENHKQLCPYSTAKLADKQQQKLQKSIALLNQYTETAIPVSDNDLYDLAKALHEQYAYAEARKCFGKMKTKNSSLEIVILQAHIERDDGKYTDALRLYDQAYDMTTSPSQRIELLLAKKRMFITVPDKSIPPLDLSHNMSCRSEN
ncbi:unnamed protein product [Rotaria sordida]|uniref:RING-type domain-containing protein n=3 Tax=Rotaria sordida TaxID=392033 RepID=A0A814ZUB8_9BILA|nr:unnamed protein product [Rotaria sordida]CAF1279921.1 unnamed protein product [Rotaria sordida]